MKYMSMGYSELTSLPFHVLEIIDETILEENEQAEAARLNKRGA